MKNLLKMTKNEDKNDSVEIIQGIHKKKPVLIEEKLKNNVNLMD